MAAAERKAQLGQFFTVNAQVQQVMVSLVAHTRGRALEPSAGAGHLVAALEQGRPHLTHTAVELDPATPVCQTPIDHADFFTYVAGRGGQYDVIFGNPPYVAWKQVLTATRLSAADSKAPYGDKANLYYLFIDRCIDLLAPGGELVFIVPKDWLYTTSAQPLRDKITATGAVTHLIDCGEDKLFPDAAVPALVIFRFVRDARGRHLQFASSLGEAVAGNYEERVLQPFVGRWLAADPGDAAALAGWGRLGDVISVKVGLVTGLDRVFRLDDLDQVEAAARQQHLTTKRQLEWFINVNGFRSADALPPKVRAYLMAHHDELMNRRITHFDEGNWWRYGAIRNEAAMASDAPRFFVPAKTRNITPFFALPGAQYFSGGILGLFPQPSCPLTLDQAVTFLNSDHYRSLFAAMFLTTADKLILQPATLEDMPFPKSLAQAEAFLARS